MGKVGEEKDVRGREVGEEGRVYVWGWGGIGKGNIGVGWYRFEGLG